MNRRLSGICHFRFSPPFGGLTGISYCTKFTPVFENIFLHQFLHFLNSFHYESKNCVPPPRQLDLSSLIRKHFLWPAFFLMLFSIHHLNAQGCEPEAQFTVMVENGSLVFQASDPTVPNATYTWAWTDSNTGSGGGTGTTYSLPIPPMGTTIHMQLNVENEYLNETCEHLINVFEDCSRAGFTTEIMNCLITFTPQNTSECGNFWDFGDGTYSDEVSPEHLFPQSGTFTVCHAWCGQNTLTQDFSFAFCCQDVTVNCFPGGGGDGSIVMGDCCRLKVCFTNSVQDPNAQHVWNFGDCSAPSTEFNPCHYYTNISTYETASVTVEHCVTIGGVTECYYQTIVFPEKAIYVGEPGVTTPITVLSCINGQALFPGNSLQGPYLQDPLTPLEVHVAGEFEINKSFTFQHYVNFCMDPCASMAVPHHRALTFDDFISVDNLDGCPLWRSIDLDYQSHFTSSNQVEIKSSLYGIQTRNYNSVISLSDTYFLDNWVSMLLTRPFTLTRFDRNLFAGTGPLDPVVIPWFSPCYIPLPEPVPFTQLQGFAGIVTDNVTLNIPGMNNPPPGVQGETIFNNLANGIVMRNTNAKIQRCRFLGITDNVYGSLGGNGIRFRDNTGSHTLRQWGIGLDNLPTFDNCVTGIHVYSDNAINTRVQSQANLMENVVNGYHFDDISGNLATGSFVSDNDIFATDRGVWLELNVPEFYLSHLRIANNHITISGGNQSTGILLQDATPFSITAMQDIDVEDNVVDLNEGRSGIEAMNFRGAFITHNTVNVNDATADQNTPFPPIGIYLNGGRQNTVNCQNTVTGLYPGSTAVQHSIVTDFSMNNAITDNTFENTRLGIQFRLPCGTQTLLRCNTMQNHEIGLDYWADAVTGHQGPNGTSRGNRWLGTWASGTVGARHQSPIADFILESQFNARIGTNQWPPSIESDYDWFFNGPSFYCPPPDCAKVEDPPLDSLNQTDTSIVNAGGLFSSEAALNRELRRYLYARLAENPGWLSSNTLMSGFQSSYDSEPEGLLYDAGQQTGNLFVLDTGTVQMLEENFTAIQAALTEIIAIDSLLALDTIWNDADTLLLLSRQQWEDTISARNQSNEQIRTQWLDDRTTGAAAVIASNNSIAADSIYDENEKTLHDIYLKTVVKGLPVTLAQKAQVLSIAGQCPEVGGYSTYWARAWHSILTGEVILPTGCQGIEERSRESKSLPNAAVESNTINVFPNPAQDEVSATYTLNPDWHNAKLVLLNSMGQIKAEYYLVKIKGQITISLASLPDGVYFLQARSGNKKSAVTKFIVIR